MLIAISGSQGSGKTTVLTQLKAYDPSYTIVERKTSRSIQTEWGKTLDEINNDRLLTLKFQDEILERKYKDEMAAVRSTYWPQLSPTITERTYADLFTYALLALGRDRNNNSWLNDYYVKCMEYQQSYDYVVYLKAGHFGIVADPNRANHNTHYSRATDLAMLDITQQMTLPSRLNVIDTPDLDQRVAIVRSHINGMVKHNANK